MRRDLLSKKVSSRLIKMMFILNLVVITGIAIYISIELNKSDERYFKEVINNISSTIETKMMSYFRLAEVLASNHGVIELLEHSSKEAPMEFHDNIEHVLQELQDAIESYAGGVMNITILSVEEDNYIMSDGILSIRDTVTDRLYYEAVTKQETIITQPYLQSQNSTKIVSTAAPVFTKEGEVLGCVVVNIPISFLSNLITFVGKTGSIWVMDGSHEILAHTDASYIGQDYSMVGIGGDIFEEEIRNPSGELFRYEKNRTSRIGAIGYIDLLEWTLAVGMDYSEFISNTIVVVIVLIVIQVCFLFLLLYICKKVVKDYLEPLKDENAAMVRMICGDLGHEITVNTDSEIGKVCDDFRLTMEILQNYVNEILENVTVFSNIDFTKERKYKELDNLEAIQNSIHDYERVITETLFALRMAVLKVSEGANQVAVGAVGLTDGSVILSDTVVSLNQVMHEMTMQIQRKSGTEQGVSTEDLLVGNEKMNTIMKTMSQIEMASKGIVDTLNYMENNVTQME